MNNFEVQRLTSIRVSVAQNSSTLRLGGGCCLLPGRLWGCKCAAREAVGMQCAAREAVGMQCAAREAVGNGSDSWTLDEALPVRNPLTLS